MMKRAVLPIALATLVGCAGDERSTAETSSEGDGDGDRDGFSLRFFGGGVNAPDPDRLEIPIDDPEDALPGPPADVGAEDFTIEFWMRDGGDPEGPIWSDETPF